MVGGRAASQSELLNIAGVVASLSHASAEQLRAVLNAVPGGGAATDLLQQVAAVLNSPLFAQASAAGAGLVAVAPSAPQTVALGGAEGGVAAPAVAGRRDEAAAAAATSSRGSKRAAPAGKAPKPRAKPKPKEAAGREAELLAAISAGAAPGFAIGAGSLPTLAPIDPCVTSRFIEPPPSAIGRRPSPSGLGRRSGIAMHAISPKREPGVSLQ